MMRILHRIEDMVIGGCLMAVLMVMWLFNVDGEG